MIDFTNGNVQLSNGKLCVAKNTMYSDIDESLYFEFGCNSKINKKIMIQDLTFYDTKCAMALFFTNEKLKIITIYNDNHYFTNTTWLSKENCLIVEAKNQQLLESIIPKEFNAYDSNSNEFRFDWGTVKSIYEWQSSSSSIQIHYKD